MLRARRASTAPAAARWGASAPAPCGWRAPRRWTGRRALLLSFDFRGRVGPAVVENHTRSWVDPDSLASLRFTKRERSPITSRNDDVRMDPARGRWEGADGTGGALPADRPLDELSFIFFIRTLPLAEGAVYSLNRHFEPGRNPVVVRVVRRGRTTVPAGEFATVEVEMRVKDSARYRGGEGVVRLSLTDDDRHLPVRIESQMRWWGAPCSPCSRTPAARDERMRSDRCSDRFAFDRSKNHVIPCEERGRDPACLPRGCGYAPGLEEPSSRERMRMQARGSQASRRCE